jgi:UDP-N-acetylglucosamine 2-epimerase (non-hydrolysing)
MQVPPAELGGWLHSGDVRLVIGTRPEAIKLAPVARALADRGIAPSLLVTGQHPGLDVGQYGLANFATQRLDIPGEEDPHAHVARVTAAIAPLHFGARSLLVVQGDTSSALGAALAGFTTGVPVAHVEAGLRTGDPALPWPEEEYRTAIDARADLMFAPTETAAANLRSEGVPGAIHVTGNTSIDALLEVERRLPARIFRADHAKTILVTCHRRESWGEGLASIAAALADLGAITDVRIDFVLHPNPHIRKRMAELLHGQSHVALIEPCSHSELIARMLAATLILSDSGGIQEEAPALGVPLLVLREKTERPEGVACGNARLVGTSAETIIVAARRILADPGEHARMAERAFPYGDGRAAPRIAAAIHDWLSLSRCGAKNLRLRN